MCAFLGAYIYIYTYTLNCNGVLFDLKCDVFFYDLSIHRCSVRLAYP